jgi:hypothetical protein
MPPEVDLLPCEIGQSSKVARKNVHDVSVCNGETVVLHDVLLAVTGHDPRSVNQKINSLLHDVLPRADPCVRG